MNEYDEKRAQALAELIKARWPQAWEDMRPVHPHTVLLGAGGAWLYLSVTARLTHIDYLAQLYGNNTGGLTWAQIKLSDVPPEEIADSIVRYLTPWLEAVQYESRTGKALEFTIWHCTSELADHTGSCGCWSIATANIHRVARHRHGRHVVIYTNRNGTVAPYVEFVNNTETTRSIEMRRRFAELA